ncbi:MAG: hypothetical protein RDU14_13785 [Melioribacteraceae bacterium]|nr:hypothetical protein [Melioribacteraceae bacterium]
MKTLNKRKSKKDSRELEKRTEIDAVEMMRSIRQKISNETKDMSFDQFSKYISKKLYKDK